MSAAPKAPNNFVPTTSDWQRSRVSRTDARCDCPSSPRSARAASTCAPPVPEDAIDVNRKRGKARYRAIRAHRRGKLLPLWPPFDVPLPRPPCAALLVQHAQREGSSGEARGMKSIEASSSDFIAGQSADSAPRIDSKLRRGSAAGVAEAVATRSLDSALPSRSVGGRGWDYVSGARARGGVERGAGR